MADGLTEAVFGDKASQRYDAQAPKAAANAFDRLVQAGVTSSMVGSDIDGVKQGQAMQASDASRMADSQRSEEYRRIMERKQALEEERERVNRAYDRELEQQDRELDNCGIMGI
jgi:hypothetical protein